MSEFKSQEKHIPYSQERVYGRLSDLKNMAAMKDQVPAAAGKVDITEDSIRFNVPEAGDIELRLAKAEPCSTIQFETVQSPLPFSLRMQIDKASDEACTMTLAIDMELNFMMAAMLKKTLSDAVNKMADTFAQIPY